MRAVGRGASLYLCLASLLLLVTLPPAAVGAAPTAAGQGDGDRWRLLDQWLTSVETHEPGQVDAPLTTAAAWPTDALLALWTDVQVLLLRTDSPGQTRFRIAPIETGTSASGQPLGPLDARRMPPPGSGQLTIRLSSADRKVLDGLAKRVRALGLNAALKRAAIVHTDVATLAADIVAASTGPTSSGTSVRVHVGDGTTRGVESVSLHWELARMELSKVKPDPRADTFVRDWYRAAVALGQSVEYFDSMQLGRGLRLFAADPKLLFFAGAEREAFAAPLFQAFARSLRGTTLRSGINSADDELAAAERYYRRALEGDPAHIEARLRLGRVLALRGRPADAVVEITRALEGGLEPLLEYYASLFLGDAHEALGHLEDARGWFQRAAALTDGARVPHLALARLAREQGDPEAARASLARAVAAPRDGGLADPWWSYLAAQGRHSGRWLDDLRRQSRHVAP